MILTEQEKTDILSKYSDNTSDELLKHLKRKFPVYDTGVFLFMDEPMKFIIIDEKSIRIKDNKKTIVNRISNLIEDEWSYLGTPQIRRTVKKYIDGISL